MVEVGTDWTPDGVALSRMVGVSASVNLPLHHKVQKFSPGTSSSGWSRKNRCKMVVVWCGGVVCGHPVRYLEEIISCDIYTCS